MRPRGDARADNELAIDLQQLTSPQAWLPLLEGVDAVINVAGILRETGRQRFQTIHYDAPFALAQACVEKGVRCFVQISALGLPADGEFIASKHRFDEALLQLPLRAVVLRPSVVYAASGSYGGTSLLRALSAMPVAQWLPGPGNWKIQPVAAEDLAELSVCGVHSAASGLHEVGGPEIMSLRDYQSTWRRWLRIPGNGIVRAPLSAVNFLVGVWETLGSGPVGTTMWRMLKRGNVTEAGNNERLARSFGFAPRALREALAAHPSQVQDRWQAQLYFLAPALRISVVALCLLSAWVGITSSAASIWELSRNSWLAETNPVLLARGAALADLVLGFWILLGVRLRLAIASLFVMVLAYTLVFGVFMPGLWLDPFGGLAKNLVILPTLAALWVLSEKR